MQEWLRVAAKRAAHALGLEITSYRPRTVGIDVMADVERFLAAAGRTIAIDAGANEGQTITEFKLRFPKMEIHSFEPDPRTFPILQEYAGRQSNVTVVNAGLGSTSGAQVFYEGRHSVMSSFLPIGPEGRGEVVAQIPASMTTLNDYCAEKALPCIHLLKTDTQGYDLEVLKGAERLFEEHRVQMVLLEACFVELYAGQPGFDDIYRYLYLHGLRLVSFYNMHYRHGRAEWCDVLFVDPAFACP